MTLPTNEAIFAVRIVTCDHYTAFPLKNFDSTISNFRKSQVKYAPVVRIFGSTPSGQKCCLHVHGVFPYFYVPSPVPSPSDDFLQHFASSIDAALNSSFENGQKNDGANSKSSTERQYVYDVSSVYAIPFYGYHPEEVLFLKICFYNPLIVKRAGEILQSGAIMNTIFQPHELHVPFELKFLIDYDLYGMDYISVKDVKFRFSGAVEKNEQCRSTVSPRSLSQKIWNVGQLENRYRLPSDVQRMATCELEADCLATDIVRPTGNDASGVQNPGVRFIWKDEISRRKSMRIDATPTIPVSQDRSDLLRWPNEIKQFELLQKILDEAQERHAENETSVNVTSELDLMNESTTNADVSFRNLSMASNRSALDAFAELMDEGTIGASESDRDGIIDMDRFSDSSEGKSDDEEDAARETIEMSQKIEEFSDSDEDGQMDPVRIQQVDGPPGDGNASGETIEVSSDSSSDDDEISGELVVPESPQAVENSEIGSAVAVSAVEDINVEGPSTSDDFAERPPSNEFLRYTRLRRQQREADEVKKSISVLKPLIKPPTRKEMIAYLADPSRKEIAKQLSRSNDIMQRKNDIDAVDLEEIQARLSPDESIMLSGAMSTGDDNLRLDQATPTVDTSARFASKSISSRRGSKDTVILSSQEKLPSRTKKRGRKLVWSQSKSDSTTRDIELRDALNTSHIGKKRLNDSVVEAKRRRTRKFTLRRNQKGQSIDGFKITKRPASIARRKEKKNVSELDAPTMADSFGFNASELNLVGAKIIQGAPCLCVMSLEVHCQTRHDLRPDPEFDNVAAIFYAFYGDNPASDRVTKGVVVVCSNEDEKRQVSFMKAFDQFCCTVVDSEMALIDAMIEIVRKYDPDILVGYEIQLLSWGFLFERAQFLNVDLCTKVSRVPESLRHSRFSTRDDWWSMADIHVAGRIVLNLGRIMRHEVTLYMYSFENVAYNVLRKRVPSYDYRTLTKWFSLSTTRWRVFDYYLFRVVSELEMMNHCDILNRSSELARLYGIQFFEVLSRGSQFRVESMLLRLAKTRNYVALSPSVRQRNRMGAPGCIALTMEPESRFYTDPVLVLDFQSLYPAMIIAYNYCFSTCLGRIRNYASGDVIEFGCHKLRVTPDLIKSLLDNLTISPAGVAFVKKEVRRGVMPKMLEEILDTRVMVKQSAKLYKNDKSLQKILDARQLGLKMIANLTYGYTAATYSGRMPCTEISDSIVQKGRETLTRAIDLVTNEKKWNARVVYGDTDSLFVLLANRTKEEAFRIGQEIVDAVTADNPKPVKLKFEKVYYPCVLQTKKRYVGYAYETSDQKEPTFDAKGIETVRRDVCPAVAKILQKALETLFVSKEVSTARQYVIRQFQRIHHGRVSPLDFIFTRKYRGREHYKPDAAAPALLIAKRRLQRDRRSEPRIKERVPYLIVNGHPGSTLISCVREPSEFAFQRGLRLNYKYYITKQICPALNRVFCLIGVDTSEWYRSMTRIDRTLYGFGLRGQRIGDLPGSNKVMTISQYFHVSECAVCRNATTRETFCIECAADPQRSVLELSNRMRYLERRRDYLYQLCNICAVRSKGGQTIECTSTVCPITYKRSEVDGDLEHVLQLRRVLNDF